ncbi:site-specific DNA-methyltransferase (plasmid) [Novosphingobium aerophilum]|uniref:site-specific DNA-methyltransferase n=1 Tax=Novosphingobium aerophilum TaxID=2839843 RepID=UPI003FD06D8A
MSDVNDPIPQITRNDEAAGSGDMVAGNIARLSALFPQIMTDGKVDFEVLRELLGDAVEDNEERYGLNWKGKRKARAFAMTPSLGTLIPAPEDSVDWDTTQNLMIEGDNLEALKLLRRSYAGKVKLIYIDPPYNTGRDFVYPDNYHDAIGNYLSITGQISEGNEVLTTDRESGGRFHTSWLNMMYPRLIVSKELLSDDGFFAISCDDEEISRVISMMEEIMGEESRIANIIWQKKYTRANDAQFFSDNHDFIVLFAKNVGEAKLGRVARGENQNAAYSNPDGHEKGPWKATPLHARSGSNTDEYKFSNGVVWKPPVGTYRRFNDEAMKKMDDSGAIWFGRDGKSTPSRKTFLSELADGLVPVTIWDYKFAGSNHDAASSLNELGLRGTFTSPKPVSLIDRLLEVASLGRDDVIMDFFAGSGTTGHAVMERNTAEERARRYILVQLPEPLFEDEAIDKAAVSFLEAQRKPYNIAELTKERLRRAGAKIREEHPDAKVDTGFRVYKLATSNLKPWQPDAEDLEASILDAVDNVLPGRTEEDLLVELLLKTGIDLTLPEEKRTITGQTVHALGGGALMVCLGDIGAKDAEALGQGMADWVDELDPVQTTVYFKDTGLGADGNRAATKANLAAILRQRLGDRIAKIASI